MKSISKLSLVLLATLTLVACGTPIEEDDLVDDVTVGETVEQDDTELEDGKAEVSDEEATEQED